MSNVTVREIVNLTADAFSVPRKAMCETGLNQWRVTWRKFARLAAVVLARRHTTATWSRIAAELGEKRWGRQQAGMKRAAEHFESDMVQHPRLAAIIREIEDRIDELHEQRLGAVRISGAKHDVVSEKSCEL